MDSAVKEKKSIVCTNLPDALNKRETLHRHFCKFGTVESVTISKTNKYAVIHFGSAEAARAAKENGSIIDKDYAPVELYFSAKSPAGTAASKQKDATSRSAITITKRLQASRTSLLQNNIRAYLNKPGQAKENTERSSGMSSKQARLNRTFVFSKDVKKSASPTKIPSVLEGTSTYPNPMSEPGTTSSSKFNKPLFSFNLNELHKEKLPAAQSEGEPNPTGVQKDSSVIFQPLGRRINQPFGRVYEKPEFVTVERPESPTSDSQNIHETPDLQEIIYKKAMTSEDRYRILDARDKFLRSQNPKVKMRVEFAVALVGVCKDMCPEKERYMREAQRRLDKYECILEGDEVDHTKAIKQYSRSSADQEEPLPHELRPSTTLDMTMTYLLHNVVSRSEHPNENLMEWYTFMWDRTRSIRKDITQQELCDLKAVELMEKCTRFHIHCSSRLCELDRHAFDPKLNDENLMKCLQSLEHMYADLHMKGIQCPREPEFRSYQVLMNLNEGDILWEMQQKTQRVLQSSEVQHALRIHLAMFQKNFVSFFRLVRQSPYITSCILHRYFFQVRSFALKRLIRAHTIPPRFDCMLPVNSTMALLGFGSSDESHFVSFSGSYGVTCHVSNNTLLMNKKRWMQPEGPIMHREGYLVDSKLVIPVAEAINGGALGPNPSFTYVPESSFDSEGYLRKDDIIFTKLPASRSERPNESRLSPKKHMPPLQPPPAVQPMFGAKSLMLNTLPAFPIPGPFSLLNKIPTPGSLSLPDKPPIIHGPRSLPYKMNDRSAQDTVYHATGDPHLRFGQGIFGQSPISKKMPEEEEMPEEVIQSYKLDLVASLINEVLDKEMYNICSSVAEDICRLEIQRKDDMAWQSAERLCTDVLLDQITANAVSGFVRGACLTELKNFRYLEVVSTSIASEVQREVATKVISSLCKEILEKATQERELQIQRGIMLLKRVQISIWLQHWKQKAAEKRENRLAIARKRRRDMENFPPSLCFSLSPSAILTSLCESNSIFPTCLTKPETKLKCIENAANLKEVEVRVAASDLNNMKIVNGTCCYSQQVCYDSKFPTRRKRSWDVESGSTAPPNKTAKERVASLLANIYDFIEELRRDSSCPSIPEEELLN